MEKITLKAYAVKHKLSIFNVVKMIKSGEIPSETMSEGNRDIIYILVDETIEEQVDKAKIKEKNQEPYSIKRENVRLKKKIIELQAEIAVLKNRV